MTGGRDRSCRQRDRYPNVIPLPFWVQCLLFAFLAVWQTWLTSNSVCQLLSSKCVRCAAWYLMEGDVAGKDVSSRDECNNVSRALQGGTKGLTAHPGHPGGHLERSHSLRLDCSKGYSHLWNSVGLSSQHLHDSSQLLVTPAPNAIYINKSKLVN